MNVFVIVDMQNDFIDGSLGTAEAQAIVPKLVEKIKNYPNKEDTIIVFTQDTHFTNYSYTLEGKKLPVPHCINGTEGHKINNEIETAVNEYITSWRGVHRILKKTFGSSQLYSMWNGLLNASTEEKSEIEFVGVCTDICVVSNVLAARMAMPNTIIKVDSSCCAGVTPEKHEAALEVMRSCQIDVY